jgi:hypothetical protein
MRHSKAFFPRVWLLYTPYHCSAILQKTLDFAHDSAEGL